ncbi:hypothetical protein ERJ75_001634500 [Trypanosoma vivax]|nr:hypothetical protein ERJ75_001634500 [Trypanosoma vivax]
MRMRHSRPTETPREKPLNMDKTRRERWRQKQRQRGHTPRKLENRKAIVRYQPRHCETTTHAPGRLERDIANFNATLRPMQASSSANALLCLSLDSGADAAQNTCRGQGTDDALACVCYDKSGNTKLPDWVDKLAAMNTALQKTLSLQTQAHALIQRTQQATAHATLTAAHRTSTAQSTRRNNAQSNSAKATKTQSSDPALEGEDTPAEKNASAECNAQHPTWKPDTQTCDSTTINTEQTAAQSRTRTRTQHMQPQPFLQQRPSLRHAPCHNGKDNRKEARQRAHKAQKKHNEQQHTLRSPLPLSS